MSYAEEKLGMEKLACIVIPYSGGRSVGIVRSWTKGHGVCLFVCLFDDYTNVALCNFYESVLISIIRP
jgi:hypothetical protein